MIVSLFLLVIPLLTLLTAVAVLLITENVGHIKQEPNDPQKSAHGWST